MVCRLESRLVGTVVAGVVVGYRRALRKVCGVVSECEEHAPGNFEAGIGINQAACHVGGASAVTASHAALTAGESSAEAAHALVAFAGDFENQHATGHLSGAVCVEYVNHVALRADVVVASAHDDMATAFAKCSILTDIILRATGAVPAVVCCERRGDAALGENLVGLDTFISGDHVDGGTLQVQCGIRMDAVVLCVDRDVATVHIDLPVSVQGVVAFGFHVKLAAIDIDVLLGDKSLACRCHLDRSGFGRIADADKVRCIDTVIACVDGDVSAGDFYNAFAFDNILAFVVDFFAFVTFEAVAFLRCNIQRAA